MPHTVLPRCTSLHLADDTGLGYSLVPSVRFPSSPALQALSAVSDGDDAVVGCWGACRLSAPVGHPRKNFRKFNPGNSIPDHALPTSHLLPASAIAGRPAHTA